MKKKRERDGEEEEEEERGGGGGGKHAICIMARLLPYFGCILPATRNGSSIFLKADLR